MATAKEVMADIFARFVDKPGHNMLAHEVAKKLDAAGYVIVPKEPTREMLLAPGVPYGGKIGYGPSYSMKMR